MCFAVFRWLFPQNYYYYFFLVFSAFFYSKISAEEYRLVTIEAKDHLRSYNSFLWDQIGLNRLTDPVSGNLAQLLSDEEAWQWDGSKSALDQTCYSAANCCKRNSSDCGFCLWWCCLPFAIFCSERYRWLNLNASCDCCSDCGITYCNTPDHESCISSYHIPKRWQKHWNVYNAIVISNRELIDNFTCSTVANQAGALLSEPHKKPDGIHKLSDYHISLLSKLRALHLKLIPIHADDQCLYHCFQRSKNGKELSISSIKRILRVIIYQCYGKHGMLEELGDYIPYVDDGECLTDFEELNKLNISDVDAIIEKTIKIISETGHEVIRSILNSTQAQGNAAWADRIVARFIPIILNEPVLMIAPEYLNRDNTEARTSIYTTEAEIFDFTEKEIPELKKISLSLYLLFLMVLIIG